MIRKVLCIGFLILGFLLLPAKARAASLSARAGAVTVSAGNLNVRSAPSATASRAATLKKGSYIILMEKTGSWWRVEYDKGKYGYCHADYITVVEGTPVSVSTNGGSLNVRSGAGTGYNRLASLANGEVVLFLRSHGNWSRILYHGTKTGYVSGEYLSNYYRSVRLNVPSFKQTDSRWADAPIGSSGKTMAQIGCATTAVAMMESYRTGMLITPDRMTQQLRYTSGGSLYWPDHYIPVQAGTGYLSAVYGKLRQGIPVLLGARNAYGGQHWVVITGYSGGTELLPQGFTICDPGSSYRENLRQFLEAYPDIYKYFYY